MLVVCETAAFASEMMRTKKAASFISDYSKNSAARELAIGQFHKFLHLFVPISPVVSAGELAVLMRDLFFDKDRNEFAVVLEQEIFSAAVEIDKGERFRSLGRKRTDDLENVVGLSCLRFDQTKDSVDRPTDRSGDLFFRVRCGTERSTERACQYESVRIFQAEFQGTVPAH